MKTLSLAEVLAWLNLKGFGKVGFLDFFRCSIFVMNAFCSLRKSGTDLARQGWKANCKLLSVDFWVDSKSSSLRFLYSSTYACILGGNLEFLAVCSALRLILCSLSCSSRSIIILNRGIKMPQGMFLARN